MSDDSKYIGFWEMAEKVLSPAGMEILSTENEWYIDACTMAHEAWAEQFNEYALSGTDDRPGRSMPPQPTIARLINELMEAHNERVRKNAPPKDTSDADKCPF